MKLAQSQQIKSSALSQKLSENSLKVLKTRYLKRDENGKPLEKPEQMFERVARNIASAELNYNSEANVEEIANNFYDLMTSLDFLPNSPTLMNAGRDLQQLSACFVLPIEDSMESIFETIKNAALIHKSGGGTGFSFSRLRPVGDFVMSTKGVSSGPVSFMRVFNSATEAVKQGGTRRGANMGVLRVDHPDILEFIQSKKNHSELQNFNISVALTETFMQAVADNGDYPLINPRTGREVNRLAARQVFKTIVNLAWETGDPGIIFIDRINEDNPTPALGEIESTNPCGEQPLLAYEACNLGSINLSNMVREDRHPASFDFDKLADVVHRSVRFLDDVIDVNNYPLERIAEMARQNRKIGLGVMGWADALVKLDIAYNSQEAVKLAEKVMGFISHQARQASEELAVERGPFPNYPNSIYYNNGDRPLRNATTTTIAPTGTLSIIANCSSGIEPLFALCFSRNVLDGQKLLEVNSLFEKRARQEGFYSSKLMEKVARRGSVQGLSEVPASIQKIFVTAHDISPEAHIRMQAAFQKHTDNAVSKTVNFSHSATPEDVEKVYQLAFRLGCKGVTIYRDGSKNKQVLTVNNKASSSKRSQANDSDGPPLGINPRRRPDVTVGRTQKLVTGCGHLYVTINEDEYGLCEVFTQMGKSGGCAASQSEAIGRLISLSLRAGIKSEAIIKHMRGIRCSAPSWQKGGKVLSCADAIAIAMENYLRDQKKISFSSNEIDKSEDLLVYQIGACPDCGGVVEHEGGCLVCRLCGYSKCN